MFTYNLVIVIDDDEDRTKAEKLFDKNNLIYKNLGKKMVIDDNKGQVITILERANIDFHVVPPIIWIYIQDHKEIPEVEKLLETNHIDYRFSVNNSNVIIINVIDKNKVCSILDNAGTGYDVI